MGAKHGSNRSKRSQGRMPTLADVLCQLAQYWMICECALDLSVRGLGGWRTKTLQLDEKIDSLNVRLADTKSPSKKKAIQAELDLLKTQSTDLTEEWERTHEETDKYKDLFEEARTFCTRSCGIGNHELFAAAVVGFDPERLPPHHGPSKPRMTQITATISDLPRNKWASLPWANPARPTMRAKRRVSPDMVHSFRLQQLKHLETALKVPGHADSLSGMAGRSEALSASTPVDEAPYLGLVFNHDLTVSRLGEAYSNPTRCAIQLSVQQFTILRFMHDAGPNGRTTTEMNAQGYTSLKQEKQKIKDKLIPLDLTFAFRQHRLIHRDLR